MRRRAYPPAHFWTSGSVGLAYQAFHPDDDLQRVPAHIAFDGRLDNRDEVRRALDVDPADSAALADAALALACYRRYGESFAGRLNGDFALTIWNGVTRELVLARDA